MLLNFRDMVGLAKAAVSGDEKALDMFAWTKGKKLSSSSSAHSFFFGTADGKSSIPSSSRFLIFVMKLARK